MIPEASASTGPPAQRSMFCLGCGYPLNHLDTRCCPECGRPFHPFRKRSFATRNPSAFDRFVRITHRLRWFSVFGLLLGHLWFWSLINLTLWTESLHASDVLLGVAVMIHYSVLLKLILMLVIGLGVFFIYPPSRADSVRPRISGGRIAIAVVITLLASLVVWFWAASAVATKRLDSLRAIAEPFESDGLHIVALAGRSEVRLGLRQYTPAQFGNVAAELADLVQKNPDLMVRLYAEDGTLVDLTELLGLIQKANPARILLYRLKMGESVYHDVLYDDWYWLRDSENP